MELVFEKGLTLRIEVEEDNPDIFGPFIRGLVLNTDTGRGKYFKLDPRGNPDPDIDQKIQAVAWFLGQLEEIVDIVEEK